MYENFHDEIICWMTQRAYIKFMEQLSRQICLLMKVLVP